MDWTLTGFSVLNGVLAGLAVVYAQRSRRYAEENEHRLMLLTGHSLRWHLNNFASEAADLRGRQKLAAVVIDLHRKGETMDGDQADAPETPRSGV